MENNDTNPTSPRLRGTRKIILIIGVLLIILALFFAIGKKTDFSGQLSTTTPTRVVFEDIKKISPKIPEQTLSLSNSPKDVAWAVFSKYLGYNKDKNLDGVKSVVYKVNFVCADKIAGDECKNRMDLAYAYGKDFKKESFVNVWSDSMQTILTTDFNLDEDNTFMTRTKAIIFFIGNGSDMKLLSYSPFKGATLEKNASTTGEELLKKLIAQTEDKDMDGLADYDEQCLGAKEGETCTQTSPKIRDTDGDGFWDGIEALTK